MADLFGQPRLSQMNHAGYNKHTFAAERLFGEELYVYTQVIIWSYVLLGWIRYERQKSERQLGKRRSQNGANVEIAVQKVAAQNRSKKRLRALQDLLVVQ